MEDMSMVEGYNALAGTQTDINRRLLRRIEALENAETGDVTDITALKTTVGDNTSGLVKDVADIEDAIGSESDATSILGRIKALEDAE
jgi:hypothetical protein